MRCQALLTYPLAFQTWCSVEGCARPCVSKARTTRSSCPAGTGNVADQRRQPHLELFPSICADLQFFPPSVDTWTRPTWWPPGPTAYPRTLSGDPWTIAPRAGEQMTLLSTVSESGVARRTAASVAWGGSFL